MDVDRIEALERQWQKEPPVGLMVQAFLQYKPPEPPIEKQSPKTKAAAIEELFKMFPGGQIKG